MSNIVNYRRTMALPVDDVTLKNMRGFMILVSPECTGEKDDQLPRSFGKISEVRPNILAQQLTVLPDGYPYVEDTGTFTATLSKFTESGFLPGTPVQDCQNLPRKGLVPVCENHYERATGKMCVNDPASKRCEATGELVSEASRRDDFCVLAVRGTDPRYVSNLLVDASISQEAISEDWGGAYCKGADGCRAHAGFKYAAEKLMPSVEKAMQDYGCKELVVTGHSLGGSVATLMGFAIKNTHPELRVDGAYSYEAPRFADAALAAAMEKSGYDVVRVTKEDDIVPLAPYYDFHGRRYQHAGREVFYKDLNGVRSTEYCASAACEANTKTCACSEGWHNWSTFPPHNIEAHTDFSSTPLDWQEASACPWPRIPGSTPSSSVVR